MSDVVDPATRSRMMAGIRGKDTKPELLVRRHLHAAGLRFRLNDRRLPGRPDIVFPRYRTAVFVHGCFWHQHQGCRFAVLPKQNGLFWREKLEGNRYRDQRRIEELAVLGWRTFVIWECELSMNRLDRLVEEIRSGVAPS